MKRLYLSAATVALVAFTVAPAMAADAMSSMKGMATTSADAKTGKASGVVMGVDAKAETVTLKHGPIVAVGWPAMTMTFKAASPALLKGIKTGDKVDFAVRVQGQNNQVTSLHKK